MKSEMKRLLQLIVCVGITCGFASAASAGPLEDLMRELANVPADKSRTDLAAHLETEGHWAFANRAGERFLASGPDEIARGLASLAPELSRAGHRIAVYIDQSTLFAAPKSLAALPQDAALHVNLAGAIVPVTRIGLTAPLVHVHPFVALLATDQAAFSDARVHLMRSMARAHVRVLAVTPGGPTLLASAPRIDPATRKPLVDEIAPSDVVNAIASARAQTVLVSGRIDDGQLITRTGVAQDNRVSISDMMRAAAVADVSLIVLQTPGAVQPGGRNWLWLPQDIPGLDAASGKLADLLPLFAGNKALVIDSVRNDDRLLLSVRTAETNDGLFNTNRWTQVLADLTANLLGKTPASSMQLSLPSAARQSELDRRVFKAIPSLLQLGYAAVWLLSLIGAPTAWRWWSRLWPQESPADYAGRAGFHAARVTRAAIFAVVFMPLAAIVASPTHIFRRLRRTA